MYCTLKAHGAAVSNGHLARCFDALLIPPLLAHVPLLSERAALEHDCGTMLEACVCTVHDGEGGAEAVAELARFLAASVGAAGVAVKDGAP